MPAAERWFHTDFLLEKGSCYRVTVPAGQVWTDWYVKNGPQGSTTFLQKPFRHCLRFSPERDPRAEFFTLVGTISESLEYAFIIGAGPCNFTAATSGEFVCFANDILDSLFMNVQHQFPDSNVGAGQSLSGRVVRLLHPLTCRWSIEAANNSIGHPRGRRAT